MPQIDWTAPLEVMRSDAREWTASGPHPAELVDTLHGDDGGLRRKIRVLKDGGGQGPWYVDDSGVWDFITVRNVAAPEQLPTPGTAPEQVDPIAAARATLEAAGYSVTAPDPEATRLAAARELMAGLEEASESTRSIPTMWRDGSYDGEALRAYDYLTTWAALRASGAA